MRRSAFVLVLAAAVGNAPPAAADDKPVPWSQAETRVGQPSVIEGRIMGIHCSPTSCLLAFDPTFDHFTAVVQAKDFKTLSPEKLNAEYVGRKVRVHGTVQLLDRKPEIVVDSADDLELVVSQQERAEKRDATQEQLVDRMDEMLDRLDTLATEMAQTQAALQQVAAALDQQSQQLGAIAAAANAPPPPGPPPPSWGEPQPRPAYETLRTVKRGMTSDEVARLVGTPNLMESNSTGGYIWDYGYGRTITFDARNRAVGLSGFPPP
jgi:hypothetical protein